jgi:hypothetical protein
MREALSRAIQRVVGQEMPLEAIFKTLTAVIVIRTVIEKLLSKGHTLLYDPVKPLRRAVGDLQRYFSWVVIFLS